MKHTQRNLDLHIDFGEERTNGKGNKSELHDLSLRLSDGHKKLKGVELSVLLDVSVEI